ncbi:MAG: hypothetical protein JJV88_02470 [Sulfurovum sp.]|nr:hypothetical protein [Sulfurovaceae bacterium]
MNESDIVKRVFLLGILKKESEETLDEVTKALVNTGMFQIKEANKVLQELKDEKYIVNQKLSIKGIAIAKEAESEFTIKE